MFTFNLPKLPDRLGCGRVASSDAASDLENVLAAAARTATLNMDPQVHSRHVLVPADARLVGA